MSIERLNNESSLVEAMQAGSEEAFTVLYRHYSPRLYLNILGMIHDPLLAEELVQELFTRIWQKREMNGMQENFSGYIFRIGQHLVHDFFRKMKRDKVLMERFRLLVQENYDHVEEVLRQRQFSAVFNKAMDQLSPQQKKVYELIKVEGYTYKKTSEIMKISPLTVKEYLVSSNKTIRSYLMNNTDSFSGLFLVLLIAG